MVMTETQFSTESKERSMEYLRLQIISNYQTILLEIVMVSNV